MGFGESKSTLLDFHHAKWIKASRFTSFAEAKNRQSYVSQQAALEGLEVKRWVKRWSFLVEFAG